MELVHPPAPLAHPLDDGAVAVLERSVEATGGSLGPDAQRYHRLMGPLAANAESLYSDLLGPLRWPRHLGAAVRFGWQAIRSARGLADGWFTAPAARALVAGLAAHSFLPLEQRPTAAIALMLGIAGHAVGWPVARGGSQRIADAMASHLRSLGGQVVTGRPIATLDELPEARAILLDVTPRQLIQIAGHRLPGGYLRRLGRYRYGPGAFKLDWALDGPIPWRRGRLRPRRHAPPGGHPRGGRRRRATGLSRRAPRAAVRPARRSRACSTRRAAPSGKQTAWAYCHVPNGSTVDMADRIEAQIERFAPGFRDRILARQVMVPGDFQRYNANYIGGDINGGVQDFRQFFTRPVARVVPYSTPIRGLYLCSSSTPPGGGVHGMCGYFAARGPRRGLRATPATPRGGRVTVRAVNATAGKPGPNATRSPAPAREPDHVIFDSGRGTGRRRRPSCIRCWWRVRKPPRAGR